jgi:hypothetical protein
MSPGFMLAVWMMTLRPVSYRSRNALLWVAEDARGGGGVRTGVHRREFRVEWWLLHIIVQTVCIMTNPLMPSCCAHVWWVPQYGTHGRCITHAPAAAAGLPAAPPPTPPPPPPPLPDALLIPAGSSSSPFCGAPHPVLTTPRPDSSMPFFSRVSRSPLSPWMRMTWQSVGWLVGRVENAAVAQAGAHPKPQIGWGTPR